MTHQVVAARASAGRAAPHPFVGVTLTAAYGALVASLGWAVFGLSWAWWLAVAVLVATATEAVVLGSRHRRWLRRALLGVVTCSLLVVSAGSLGYALTPGVADAERRVDVQATAHGDPAPVLRTPRKVAAALVATEDSRFYTNGGMDLPGLGRAALGLVRGDGSVGGATLEQQLAKMLYTDGRSTLANRWEEVVLAVKLAHQWSKQRILGMYLATAYFGHGYYGLQEAARGYFGVAPDRLDWPRAALLAGLVQAPSAYDPVRHPRLAAERRAHVLQRLADTGTITPAHARRDSAAPLGLR